MLAIPGLKFYGISDVAKLDRRCPTVAVRIAGHTPLELATRLGECGIFTWDGNYYALNLTERLDVEKDGGFLRIGLAHYNTASEVERLLQALQGDSACLVANQQPGIPQCPHVFTFPVSSVVKGFSSVSSVSSVVQSFPQCPQCPPWLMLFPVVAQQFDHLITRRDQRQGRHPDK